MGEIYGVRNRVFSIRAFVIISLLGAIAVVYTLFDPSSTWWMPKCPVKFLTDYDCPGCGSQRAIHSLLHGHIREAFEHNAFLILMIPFIIFMAFTEINRARYPRLYRAMSHPLLIITLMTAVAGWTILRNLISL